MRDGFLRVAAATPRVEVADVNVNLNKIKRLIDELGGRGVEVIVFPEMCLTGYTCGDLFHNATLLDAAESALANLIDYSMLIKAAFIVGLPVRTIDSVCNVAAFIEDGNVQLRAKHYIPNYNEFYERRWWSAPIAGTRTAFRTIDLQLPLDETAPIATHGTEIGIEICEDLWAPVPPSCHMALSGATVIFNPSASNDLVGKYDYVRNLISGQSARLMCGYVYAGAGYGESSTDLVFDGKAIVAENGEILAERERWSKKERYVIADVDIRAIYRDRIHITSFADCARNEAVRASVSPDHNTGSAGRPSGDQPQNDLDFPFDLYRTVSPYPFVPQTDSAIDERAAEVIRIQSAALERRLSFIKCDTTVIGISGGLDSTLALLVATHAYDRLKYDRKGIIGVTMPGYGTSDRTRSNARKLMEKLGVTVKEISIVPAVAQHFSDIGHDPAVHDTTYENSQARQRTMLLMDIANQTGGIVLGTGDLSELALGWATYNGDHMSMYGINAGIPKTLVKHLVKWFARNAGDPETAAVLDDIVDTPISPELTPADADGSIAQKTEDLVGPYELHDFFIYYMLRYGFTPRRIYLLALKAFDGTSYTSEVILKWLKVFYRRFFAQQFKRSCMPDGPKVGSVCLSPRGDWRMPSDASAALWLKQVAEL